MASGIWLLAPGSDCQKPAARGQWQKQTAMKKNLLFLGLLLALFACNNTPKPETDNTPQEPKASVTVNEAIQLLSDSIAMDSTNARLYVSRAKAYFATEQIGQALIDITQALQLDPNNIDAHLLLADG